MPQSTKKTCVIIGAGHAGSVLAVQLRKEGWTDRIVLIGEEAHLPYHRPPLSKDLLAGEKEVAGIALRGQAAYDAAEVEMRLGERVERVIPELRTLRLSSGEELVYDALALCTGASVRHIELGDGLDGVHYLRTADDAMAIRTDMRPGGKAVVVGGGYIGLEVASVLARKGMHVTLLERAGRILERVTSPVISEYFTALHQDNGVDIVTDAVVTGIGGEGRVSSVLCEDGSEYAADLVVIGVGVNPESTLAEEAGLQVGNGIVVDEYTRTSVAEVYAAGDCTWHPSALYGRQLRLESVQNALDQARVAAANIAGREVKYEALPWFWSDQYDIKLQIAGLPIDYDHFVIRGDRLNRDGRGFAVFYFRGEKMVAADCVDRSAEFLVCKKLIGKQLPVNMQALADEAWGPDSFEMRDDFL